MLSNKIAIKTIFLILVLIIGSSGFLAIIILTSNFTIGLCPDSVAYISAAKNFYQGRGFSVLYDDAGREQLNIWLPMRDNEAYHVLPWPPFYPLILSIPLFLNFDVIEGARWISAILFAMNIFLIIFIIKKLTSSNILSIIAGLLFLTSKVLINVFTFAWSETVFLFTGFLGLYFLIRYMETVKYKHLIISTILIAITSYTRTAGLAFIALAIIVILFFNKAKIARKIINSIVYLAISMLPLLSWVLWTGRINKMSNYEFLYHPPSTNDYIQLMQEVSAWFIPGRIPFKYRFIMIAFSMVIAATLLILFTTKHRNNPKIVSNKLNLKCIFILIIFIILYFLILMLSKTFLDANVPFAYTRILSPIKLSIIIIILLISKIFIDFWRDKKIVKPIVITLLCMLVLFNIMTIIFGPLIKDIYYYGQQYTSSKWINSKTIEEVKKLPQDALIYTNSPDAVYILTGRNVKILPNKYIIYTKKENVHYLEQLESIGNLQRDNSFIIFFDSGWYYIVNENELKEKLILIKDTEDGAIYKTRN